MDKKLDPRAKALALQLKADIARSDYSTAAGLHRELVSRGVVADYATLTQRIKGNAPIPMADLFMYLDVLGVEPDTFFSEMMAHVRAQGAA